MLLSFFAKVGCFSKRQPLFFLLLLSLFFSNSCKDENASHRDFQTLFSVNDISVDVYNFESKYVAHLIKTGKNDSKTERYSFLNEYIDKLVLADASEERGLLDHPTYLSALNFQKRKSMMDVFFTDEMDKLIEPPTDEEVRLAYAKKQRKVYVRQLFSLRETDLVGPYKRLLAGENFVDVANEYFETPEYDSTAGYLGPISYFGVDDAFAETAYSLNQGEFSKPIKSMFGYHIVYVEYIEFPALLAEDDYQYRKTGVNSQLRIRKQNLTSNSYVSDLMSTLLVEVDSKKILELKETIENLSSGQILNNTNEQERESDFWNDSRLSELKASFDGNVVLATFLFGGERVDFTFDDYLKWLPFLSFKESKTRTGASVGRGLRNEVLFKLADQNEYSSDIRVQERVRQRGYDVLSELYQSELHREVLSDTSSIEVPQEFITRLIRNREIQIEASYWKVLVDSRNKAEEIKNKILAGTPASSYETYVSSDLGIIHKSNSDYSLIKSALVNTPLIGHSNNDGWMVINVTERSINDITKLTRAEDIELTYKIYKTINNEIIDLRKLADIKVDTLLFDEIYQVYKK